MLKEFVKELAKKTEGKGHNDRMGNILKEQDLSVKSKNSTSFWKFKWNVSTFTP